MTKVPTTEQATFDFGFFSNEKKKSDEAYVSIDKQGRVYMNADAQKLFGIEKGKPADVQLGYRDGVIYMAKMDSPNAAEGIKPFRFSGERAYASAKTLIESLKIAPQGEAKSEKYLFDESFTQFEGVFAFKHEKLVDNSQVTIDDVLEGDATTEVAATEEKEPKKPTARNKRNQTA
jgi:hypothetical protein